MSIEEIKDLYETISLVGKTYDPEKVTKIAGVIGVLRTVENSVFYQANRVLIVDTFNNFRIVKIPENEQVNILTTVPNAVKSMRKEHNKIFEEVCYYVYGYRE